MDTVGDHNKGQNHSQKKLPNQTRCCSWILRLNAVMLCGLTILFLQGDFFLHARPGPPLPRRHNSDSFAPEFVKTGQMKHHCSKGNSITRPPPNYINYTKGGEFWQINPLPKGFMFLYSAYYDDRPLAGALPYVRVISLASHELDAELFCQVYFDDDHAPYAVHVELETLSIASRKLNYKGITYRGWIYSCRLKSTCCQPSHVSIVSSMCEKSKTFLEVKIPEKNSPVTFGICLSVSFGNILNVENLIEWFEFYNILGVKEIIMYNCTLPWYKYHNVLNHYIKQGALLLHELPAPLGVGGRTNHPGTCWPNLQISLNDCLMRYMYRHKWQLVVDVDEFIIPKKSRNLQAMIEQINTAKNVSDVLMYTFYNDFHFLDLPRDDTKPKFLRTMSYRLYDDEYMGSYKSIVNPLQCAHAFSHACVRALSNTSARVRVPREFGASQHYRYCPPGYKGCRTPPVAEKLLNQTLSKDTNILKFENVLRKKVASVLKKLSIKVTY